MLLIEQFECKAVSQRGTVRCPACRVGRLFDKGPVTQVSAVSPMGRAAAMRENQILIKCPKCSRLIGVTFAH